MPFPKCVALVVCVFQTSPDACSIFCLVCVWITHWLSQIIVLLHRHFLLLVLLCSILSDSKPEVPPSSSSFLQGNSQYVMSWSHNTTTLLCAMSVGSFSLSLTITHISTKDTYHKTQDMCISICKLVLILSFCQSSEQCFAQI